MNETIKQAACRTLGTGTVALGVTLAIAAGAAPGDAHPITLATHSSPASVIAPSFPHPDIPDPRDKLKDAGKKMLNGGKEGWRLGKKYGPKLADCGKGALTGGGAAAGLVTATGNPEAAPSAAAAGGAVGCLAGAS